MIRSHLLIGFAESVDPVIKMSDIIITFIRTIIVTIIFVIYAVALQALFSLTSLCVPLHNSPLGELGPRGTVCPLAADTSANILEFSSSGEHCPLPGR